MTDIDTIREQHSIGPAYRTYTCVHGPEVTPGDCHVTTVLADADRLAEALEATQWSDGDDMYPEPFCKVCMANSPKHKDDCHVAAALAAHAERVKP